MVRITSLGSDTEYDPVSAKYIDKPGAPAIVEFADVYTNPHGAIVRSQPIDAVGFNVRDAVPNGLKNYFEDFERAGVGTRRALAMAADALYRIGILGELPAQPPRERLS
jgi:hypothetical protein